ncbi:MAG: beta-ketoacyl-[acyl-carrier-protein] synthase family protein [Deltaproteobacteria bacterium]|nr:beta-ketoacyl-[acyl-carrier-protein] synthase family protein [Candidatus Zymogenaceae bacterium]
MSRRVVITGAGVVSCLGVGIRSFVDRLFAGDSGIRDITRFDTCALSSHKGALLSDFNPKEIINPKGIRKMDDLSRTAVAATRLAADDAKIVIDPTNRDRIGIILGTSFGSTDISIMFARTLFSDGPMLFNPLHVPNTVMNAPAGHASIELGFRGFNSTINHKESSAETAIGYAFDQIRAGVADIMFAGGVDIISPLLFEVLTRFNALSPAAGRPEDARPYDLKRSGPVVGEGAGIICLESSEHAEARGAEVYAEVSGFGMSSSPAPPSDFPADPRGYVLAIRRALESAVLSPGDIDYISGTANGGMRLDALETAAIASVFGTGADGVSVSSIKGAIGELFGAGGGIRAAALAASIKGGIIPPVVGLNDPISPLNFVTQKRETPIANALLCGVSSGGTFVALVFKTP